MNMILIHCECRTNSRNVNKNVSPRKMEPELEIAGDCGRDFKKTISISVRNII